MADWSGPTNSLLLLLKHLGDQFEARVLVPGQGAFTSALDEAGIGYRSVPSLKRRSIRQIRRLIRKDGYDLVYGNNTSGGCRNAMIAAKLARRPFICHVRGMGKRGQWKRLGFLRLADAVIAVSEATARSVAPYVDPTRLHVVHNGVDTDTFDEEDSEGDKRELRLPDVSRNRRLIASVSHLCPRKGQLHAVEAMAGIASAVPSAHLLLIGALDRDPEYVSRVEERIRELGLQEHATVLGFRRDVHALLRESELLLHTAISDPHPRAVIEAMAMGLPVVGFGIDGVSETVDSGSTGFLCAVGDVEGLARAAERLLLDSTLRRECSNRARRLARERFSADATARRVRTIIEQTLAATGWTPDTIERPRVRAGTAGPSLGR